MTKLLVNYRRHISALQQPSSGQCRTHICSTLAWWWLVYSRKLSPCI